MGCKAGEVRMGSEAGKKSEEGRQYLVVKVRRGER
jgi:hypothetical protein